MVGRSPFPVPSKALADQLTSLPADQFARKMEISLSAKRFPSKSSCKYQTKIKTSSKLHT